jgi:hypothetical protein
MSLTPFVVKTFLSAGERDKANNTKMKISYNHTTKDVL